MAIPFPYANASTLVSDFPGLLNQVAEHVPQSVVVTAAATPDLSLTNFLVIDATAGDVALDLPDPALDETLQHRRITVARSPGGTSAKISLAGGSPTSIAEGAAQDYISDGSAWYAVG